LRWESRAEGDDDPYVWLVDADGTLIAEVYQRDTAVKWHCKTSDWREVIDDVPDLAEAFELAKLRAVVSHVAHLYQQWADASVKARTAAPEPPASHDPAGSGSSTRPVATRWVGGFRLDDGRPVYSVIGGPLDGQILMLGASDAEQITIADTRYTLRRYHASGQQEPLLRVLAPDTIADAAVFALLLERAVARRG
jgi:hypothetical protein